MLVEKRGEQGSPAEAQPLGEGAHGTRGLCCGARGLPASPQADTATPSSKAKQLPRVTQSQTRELSQTPPCCPQSSRAEPAPFAAQRRTLASKLSAELSKTPVWFANVGYAIWTFCCSATTDTHYPV